MGRDRGVRAVRPHRNVGDTDRVRRNGARLLKIAALVCVVCSGWSLNEAQAQTTPTTTTTPVGVQWWNVSTVGGGWQSQNVVSSWCNTPTRYLAGYVSNHDSSNCPLRPIGSNTAGRWHVEVSVAAPQKFTWVIARRGAVTPFSGARVFLIFGRNAGESEDHILGIANRPVPGKVSRAITGCNYEDRDDWGMVWFGTVCDLAPPPRPEVGGAVAAHQVWLASERCAWTFRLERIAVGADDSVSTTHFVISSADVTFPQAGVTPDVALCPAAYLHLATGNNTATLAVVAEGLLAVTNTCKPRGVKRVIWEFRISILAQAEAESLTKAGCSNGSSTEGDNLEVCLRARVTGGSAGVDYGIEWFHTPIHCLELIHLSETPPRGILIPGFGDVEPWSWDEAWARTAACWDTGGVNFNPLTGTAWQAWWDTKPAYEAGTPPEEDTAVFGTNAGIIFRNIGVGLRDLWASGRAAITTVSEQTSGIVEGFGVIGSWMIESASCVAFTMGNPDGDNMAALLLHKSGCSLLVDEDGILAPGVDFTLCGEEASLVLWPISGMYGLGAPASVWDCRGPEFDLSMVTDALDDMIDDLDADRIVKVEIPDVLTGRWINSCSSTHLGKAADMTGDIAEIVQYTIGILLMWGFARAIPRVIAGKA